MRAWQLLSAGLDHMTLVERADPVLRDHEAVVRMRAASINYRVVDRVWPFEQARAAVEALEEGTHFGKTAVAW